MRFESSIVIEQALPEDLRDHIPVVKIGGPIIAKELAHSMYTEAVFASKKDRATKMLRRPLIHRHLKVILLQILMALIYVQLSRILMRSAWEL